LQQGDLSVRDYCCQLKRLGDTLTDVGHPVTNQVLVVNLLHDLSSKFSNALGVFTAMNPLSSFLWVHSYLLQETRVDRSLKMEAANTLVVAAGSSAGTPAGTPTGVAAAALVATIPSAAPNRRPIVGFVSTERRRSPQKAQEI
jgi:hypothetical protein